MTTIIMAAGLCSAIRPKLLTALPFARYPNVKITAWGEGHWHIDCPDDREFPDADPWVKRHIAHIDVTGAPSFAAWVEYVACRAIAADDGKTGTMYLLSTPLDARNIKWAAKHNKLPDAGEWRQAGCKAVAPTGPAKRKAPARRTPAKRKPAPKPAPRGGILARLFRRR
jgi:hypothetical protein